MCCIDILICTFPCLFPESWQIWQFQTWEEADRHYERYQDEGPIQFRRQRPMSLTSLSFLSPTPRNGTPDIPDTSTIRYPIISIPMTALTKPSSTQHLSRQNTFERQEERDKEVYRDVTPFKGGVMSGEHRRLGINYGV